MNKGELIGTFLMVAGGVVPLVTFFTIAEIEHTKPKSELRVAPIEYKEPIYYECSQGDTIDLFDSVHRFHGKRIALSCVQKPSP